MVDRVDELLARIDPLDDLVTQRLFLNALEETLDDGQRHVRLEERNADLAQRVFDVLFGELPSTEITPDAAEAFGEVLEHGLLLTIGSG